MSAVEPETIGAVTDPSLIARVLGYVPRILSSKSNILLLLGLGVYLVVLPLTGLYTPSANAMLIGGNFTNVTSDLGACIAAGGTLTVLHRQKRHHQERMAQAEQHHADLVAQVGALGGGV